MEDMTPPAEKSLQLVGRNMTNGDHLRPLTISLDGLLDYDESDREECTMELNLFAEAFHEMMMRDAGERILQALIDEKYAAPLTTSPFLPRYSLCLYIHIPCAWLLSVSSSWMDMLMGHKDWQVMLGLT